MPFDPKAKENAAIVNYLKARRILILDPTATSRRAIQKVLSNLGLPSSQVDAAELYGDAESLYAKHKHPIVISEFKLDKNDGLKLLDLMKADQPDAMTRTFVLITSDNSKVMAGNAAEAEVDSVVVKPFNFQSLEDKLIAIIKTKCQPSDYYKKIEEAKLKLNKGELDPAFQIVQECLKLDPKPCLAHYFLGQISEKKEQLDEAASQYEQGLKHDATHRRCLEGAMQLYARRKNYAKAYELGTQLVKVHGVSSRLIGELVRLSVYNAKYEEVIDYCNLFASIDDMDALSAQYISAGIVVCGKYLAKMGRKDDAVSTLTKIDRMSKGKPTILREAAATMIRLGARDEAQKFISRTDPEVSNAPEVLLAELEFMNDAGGAPATETLAFASKILQNNVRSPKLYEILIARSIELKRKESSIHETIEEACKHFPDHAESFKAFASKIAA